MVFRLSRSEREVLRKRGRDPSELVESQKFVELKKLGVDNKLRLTKCDVLDSKLRVVKASWK